MTVGALLEARELAAGYGATRIISGVDLTIGAGEVVCLLGANGAGKTTTLRALAGEIVPMAGAVRWRGERATGPPFKRARQGLAFVTEERSLFSSLTVEQNLRLGAAPVSKAVDLMPELGALLPRRAGLLSGGEQQMLVLARALAGRPTVLLADELSFGLAPLVVSRLLDAIREAATRHAVGVLLVEQHVRRVLEIADRGYVLSRGRIVMEGDTTSLRRELPEIEATYLSSFKRGPD